MARDALDVITLNSLGHYSSYLMGVTSRVGREAVAQAPSLEDTTRPLCPTTPRQYQIKAIELFNWLAPAELPMAELCY